MEIRPTLGELCVITDDLRPHLRFFDNPLRPLLRRPPLLTDSLGDISGSSPNQSDLAIEHTVRLIVIGMVDHVEISDQLFVVQMRDDGGDAVFHFAALNHPVALATQGVHHLLIPPRKQSLSRLGALILRKQVQVFGERLRDLPNRDSAMLNADSS
ncbi:hypothetical protein D3C80_1164470 [compost metagenome]